MKIDIPFLQQVIAASKRRLDELLDAYKQLTSQLSSISLHNWEDGKRKQLEEVIKDIENQITLVKIEQNEYLAQLETKIAVLKGDNNA